MQEKFIESGSKWEEYSVRLTEEFMTELDEIDNYISHILKIPRAAKRLQRRIINTILLLENSPQMYEEIEKIGRTKRKYRRMVISNYVVLYTIEKSKRMIYVSHIYYNKRNYIDFV